MNLVKILKKSKVTSRKLALVDDAAVTEVLNKLADLLDENMNEILKVKKVAERQIAGVKEILGKLKLPIEEKIEYYGTQCPGSQINIVGEFTNTILGVDNLGKLGKSAEEIGQETARNFLEQGKSEACLDKHSADQILPFMALASGKSQVSVSEVTEHCKANIWVIEKFSDGKFKIKDNLISWLPK